MEVLAGQYISKDGHIFDCEDPAHPPCHIIFAIDRSSSMWGQDKVPQSHFPGLPPAVFLHKNRYGCVLVALYRFLKTVQMERVSQGGAARDAFSCILFNSNTTVPILHDEGKSSEELIKILSKASVEGGTNFNRALDEVASVMTTNWNAKRQPVVIFLSDGEDQVNAGKMRGLCESAVNLGKPLAFYAISFGTETYSGSLRDMARIARQIYQTAAVNVSKVPCVYNNALDAVQLEDVFLDIAESVRSQRATLVLK